MLGLETETGVLEVGLPALADERAVEEVAGIELDAGLVGEDFHRAAALGFVDFGGLRPVGEEALFQDVIVVVADRSAARFLKVAANGRGIEEVPGRAFYVADFAGGNESGVD